MTGSTLVLLGAGGTGREVIDLVAALAARGSGIRIEAILDDDVTRHGTRLNGIPIAGPLSDAARFPTDIQFVDALGSPANHAGRPALLEALGIPRERFATLVHPGAIGSPSAELGAGCLILAGTVLGAGARLGDHVTALPGVVVSHDAIIADWSILATGAIVSGGVRVGRCCYIGAGATIRETRAIGDGALVGMGSVVVRDVPAGAVIVGNPARILRGGDANPAR